MSNLLTLSTVRSSSPLPTAPWDLQEELELYARESGRTAKFHFVPFGGWMARFSLRSNDERMRLYQEGRAPEPPTEDVWFHVKNPYENETTDIRSKPEARQYPLIEAMCYGVMRQGPWLPLDITKMGKSGVREFLEKGNLWSGRGEHGKKSLEQIVREAVVEDEQKRAAFREQKKIDNRLEQREKRRSLLKIPFLGVGIDLKGKQGA